MWHLSLALYLSISLCPVQIVSVHACTTFGTHRPTNLWLQFWDFLFEMTTSRNYFALLYLFWVVWLRQNGWQFEAPWLSSWQKKMAYRAYLSFGEYALCACIAMLFVASFHFYLMKTFHEMYTISIIQTNACKLIQQYCDLISVNIERYENHVTISVPLLAEHNKFSRGTYIHLEFFFSSLFLPNSPAFHSHWNLIHKNLCDHISIKNRTNEWKRMMNNMKTKHTHKYIRLWL